MRGFISDSGWWFLGMRDGVPDRWRSLSRLAKLSLIGFALCALCYGAYVPLVHAYGVTIHPLHARPTLDPIGTWTHEYAQVPLQTLIGLALALLIIAVTLLYVAACVQSIGRSLVAMSLRRRHDRGDRPGAASQPADVGSAARVDGVDGVDGTLWDEVVAAARDAGSEHL